MSEKKKLSILGLSYSQTQSGAYALVLEESGGNRRIPIIIGAIEAQSIAIHLENLIPPRPLTHDLFKTFSDSFEINLKEVLIYKLEKGVFYSELVCESNSKTIRIDSRTSDAVALALRFTCDIYVTEEILDKSGIVINVEEEDGSSMIYNRDETIEENPSSKNVYSQYNLYDLNEMLDRSIKMENYEEASKIKKEIEKRETKK